MRHANLPPRVPEADLLLANCSEIVTPVGEPPFRGERLGALSVIPEGRVAFKDGKVAAVGTARELAGWDAAEVLDCRGGTVVPGLVDAHTHLVWAGNRAHELTLKLRGATYQEIAAQGGGIAHTVRATRAARVADLAALARKRLDRCLAQGTTTMEVKSGYGLTVEDELKLLRAVQALDDHAVDLVATLLGAHALPEDSSREAWLEAVCDELTPRVAKEGLALSCDAFVDEGAFTVEEGRRVLEAGRERGLDVRLHADELACTRATRLGLDLDAMSVDHLNRVHADDLEALGDEDALAAAVLCPVTPFTTRIAYAPARALVEAGATVALGSDLNPNAWSEGMLLTIALAVHEMRLTPAQALTAATANSAYALGLTDRGRLEPGLVGDAVVFDMPAHAYLGYRVGGNRARFVIKDGRVVASA